MKNFIIVTLQLIVILAVVALAVFLTGYAVSFFWNATLPHILGLPTIGIGQGFALFALVQLVGCRTSVGASKKE